MDTQSIAQSLQTAYKWTSNTISYSFKNSQLYYESKEDYYGTTFVSQAMKNAVHEIFQYASSLLNINLVYTQGVGDIVISSKSMDNSTLGYSYLAGTTYVKNSSGDMYINSDFTNVDFQRGALGYSTIIHELGHVLGLNHPFNDGYYSLVDISQSIMSYNNFEYYDSFNNRFVDTYSYLSYQPADIIALQTLYGVRQNNTDNIYDLNQLLYKNSINSLYGTINESIYTIDDIYGKDTLDLSNILNYQKQYLDISNETISVINIVNIYN